MTHPEAISPDSQRPHCQFCGRFFCPDPRVGARQKSCGQTECRKKRKQAAQLRWTQNNPDYFKGRCDVVREWRSRHPDGQRKWRAKQREMQNQVPCNASIVTMRLAIMDPGLKNELQDEIRRQKAQGTGFLVAGRTRVTRRDSLASSDGAYAAVTRINLEVCHGRRQ